MLQGHITLWLETNTSTEDVGQGTSLLSKSIDDGCSWRSQGGLEHVAEDAKNTMEVLEVLSGSPIGGCGLPLNASHHLSDENKIDDQWGCKKRILANIEETK